MPQIFQVLRCFKCLVFQVHQTKKSNKFECKLCGEKQSVKRHYGIGTAKDCRLHVQKLNEIRGDIDELKESTCVDKDNEYVEANSSGQSGLETMQPIQSKWSRFLDDVKELEESGPEVVPMTLNGAEAFLELPKKRRKTNFKCPKRENFTDYGQNHNGQEKTYEDNTETVGKEFHRYSDSIVKNSQVTLEHNVSITKNDASCEMNKSNSLITDNQNNKVSKKFVVPMVDRNSKWAQFVEENEEADNISMIDEYITSNKKKIDNQNYSKENLQIK